MEEGSLMPIYSFEDEKTKKVVEIVMPMADAIPVGEIINRFFCPRCETVYAEYVNGCPVCYRRLDDSGDFCEELVSVGQVRLRRLPDIGVGTSIDNFQTCRSVQMPRFHPDAPRVDRRGCPVFANRQETREFEARTEGTAHHYHYD